MCLSRNLAADESEERLPVVSEHHQSCMSSATATASPSWPDELFPVSTVSSVVMPCQAPEEGIKIAVISLSVELMQFVCRAYVCAEFM